MAALQQHVAAIKRAYYALDSTSLHCCFRLDLRTYQTLKADLLRNPGRDLAAWTLQQIPVSGSSIDSDRFQTLVADLLAYVRDFPHPAQISAIAGATFDNAEWDKAYDAWAMVYARASTFFSLPDTTWFVPNLRFFASSLVSLAMSVDQRLDPTRKRKTTDAAGRLSKSAGMAGNDRSQATGADTKRAAVLMLSNLSFKAYFNLNNTRLCETVLGSVENALKLNRTSAAANGLQDDTGEACYSKADRVTYRYYLGRLRLFQHNIRTASVHLRWAFDHCTVRKINNKRAILIPLVATYLILGRYPDETLLASANLQPYFSGMVRRLKAGDASGTLAELDKNMDWFRVRGLYLILREKLQISLWRNLARRCLAISRSAAPVSSAPPTLRLDLLLLAARLSWQDASLELEDIEAVLASLIDQGYVKGYILHSKSMLVLQKGPHMGFPPIHSIFEVK
ncbi:hypothetical protein BCV70DRAFT_189069 [Testicularia cyperi]|uniref:PCI domain-containing protein n=1 Tax=Testicularia cyperi TaxID=1882483 RepID=A0A317XRT6_9BASI|nr:hypothetical protein BCV70DRAFT_189069 [Testicularia cyperi]